MASEDPALYWRIGIVMAERGIRTVRELRRRLSRVGYHISEPQLGRIRKQLPKQIDTRLLAALCAALETNPGELLALPLSLQAARTPAQKVEPPAPAADPATASEQPPASQPVRQAPNTTTDALRAVVGPKLRPRSLPSP